MAESKRFLMGGLVALLSTVLSFGMMEIAFRLLLFSDASFMAKYRDPGLYATEYSDDYWKLRYWFVPKSHLSPIVHPLLSWAGHFEPDHYQHKEANRLNGRRPVLLYGDSFAQCAIPNQDCYQQFLNVDPEFTKDHYFLNYGVGGYGIDQEYLLLRESLHLYQRPVVFLGLMTGDLDRALMRVRGRQKPVFELKDDALTLANVPIDPDLKHYFLEHPPDIYSYLYRLWLYSPSLPGDRLRNAILNPAEDERRIREEAINRHLIHAMIELIRSPKADLTVIVFSVQHEVGKPDGRRLSFFRDVLGREPLPIIWTKELIERDMKETGRPLSEYFLPVDQHPSQYQNQLIAKRIKERVLAAADNRTPTSATRIPSPLISDAKSTGYVTPASVQAAAER
jgi:hypothetical protein